MNEMDKKLLSTIKYYITQNANSIISPRLQKMSDGKIPKWVVELLGYVQIWNRGHGKDLININPQNINKEELLARITELEKKFSK